VAKRGQTKTNQVTKTPFTQVDRTSKAEARKRLLTLAGLTPEPSRQGIWEPEMDNYRKAEIPELEFKNQVEAFIRKEFGVENAVQTCR